MASDRGPMHLNMPELKAPFTAEDVILWLGDCDDAIEAFEDLKRREETLSVVRQITEAGMKMQGEGKIWWNQNKEELKALATWSLFAAEVRARFLDSGFVLTAEHEFYRTAQGSEPFAAYAAKLASRRATLGIGKDGGKIINDDQFKRHLLHHANDLLYARTTSTAGFSLSTFSVNDLIGHMTAVASSLGHEWLSLPRSLLIVLIHWRIVLFDAYDDQKRERGGGSARALKEYRARLQDFNDILARIFTVPVNIAAEHEESRLFSEILSPLYQECQRPLPEDDVRTDEDQEGSDRLLRWIRKAYRPFLGKRVPDDYRDQLESEHGTWQAALRPFATTVLVHVPEPPKPPTDADLEPERKKTSSATLPLAL